MGSFEIKSVVIDLNQLWDYVIKIPIILALVLTGWCVLRHTRRIILKGFQRTPLETKFSQLAATLIRVIGWTIILAASFSVLGLNEISLLFSGSIALLALGVAQGVNGIISDWLSGLFLVADSDFQPGRRIKIGAVEGTIVSMGIRKTKVVDNRGDIHIIPNRNIDNSVYLIRRPRKSSMRTAQHTPAKE